MNDSMAIIATYDTEEEFCSAMGSSTGGSGIKVKNCRLLLVDIRFKKKYWEKKVKTEDCSMNLNSIQDSVLIFRRAKKIAFLKLGDTKFQQSSLVELKIKEMKFEGDDWKHEQIRVNVRPWQNGLILVNSKYEISRDNYGNEYALLDTATGSGKLWQPSSEFEWLNECADAKWSSAGGLCLKELPDTLGFVLLRNGVDTLAVRYIPYKLPSYYREENSLIFSGNGIISGGWIYLMSLQGQLSENPLDVWARDMGYFRDLSGERTSYGD